MDTDAVKEYYASMSDEQLIHFVTNEFSGISQQATDLLKEQFAVRKLDIIILEEALSGVLALKNQEITRLERTRESETGRNYADFILSSKRDGNPDSIIFSNLLLSGFTEEQAYLLMSGIKQNAVNRSEKADKRMLTGLFAFLAGAGISLISRNPGALSITTVLTGCTMVTGIFIFLYYLIEKGKYHRILKNIKEENPG